MVLTGAVAGFWMKSSEAGAGLALSSAFWWMSEVEGGSEPDTNMVNLFIFSSNLGISRATEFYHFYWYERQIYSGLITWEEAASWRSEIV